MENIQSEENNKENNHQNTGRPINNRPEKTRKPGKQWKTLKAKKTIKKTTNRALEDQSTTVRKKRKNHGKHAKRRKP